MVPYNHIYAQFFLILKSRHLILVFIGLPCTMNDQTIYRLENPKFVEALKELESSQVNI